MQIHYRSITKTGTLMVSLLMLTMVAAQEPTVTRYSYENTSGGLGSNRVYAVAIQPETSGRVIWFGLRNYSDDSRGYEGGMSRLELDTWGNETWTLFTPLNSGLPDDFIWDLEFDPDGNLWIGTADAGVAKLDATALGESPGTTGWTVYDQSTSGLGFDRVYDLAVAPDGTIWFGHGYGDFEADAAVSIFDGVSQWRTITETNSPLIENTCYAIAMAPDGKVWLGHKWQNAFFKLDHNGTPFDDSDDIWTKYTTTFELINAGSAVAHPNGDAWFGHPGPGGGAHTGGGVSRYVAAEDTVIRYEPLNTTDIVIRVRAAVIDSYGIVWLGDKGGSEYGSTGLWKFDPETMTEPEHVYRQLDDEGSVNDDDNFVNQFAIDEENEVIWLATDFYSEDVETFGVVKIEGLWEPKDTSTSVVDDRPGIPAGFTLAQNYPNPFNPATLIEYSLDRARHIELAVYDITGKLVRTLDRGYRNAGRYAVTWDGRADNGLAVSSGLYFYRLAGEGGRQLLRKAVYLK
ncbi:MAG: T9SS type A sorting domain-containing protein [Fidelibacterota bacterium]|nr:MAG: T9SS type A sorting domain-containing protein [Candidatus Neomarinimicrobiota bacterium]